MVRSEVRGEVMRGEGSSGGSGGRGGVRGGEE